MKNVLKILGIILISLIITILLFIVTNQYHLGDTLTPFIVFKSITFLILVVALLLGIVYFSNNKLWIVLLIIGFIPFLIALLVGIYFAINGFSGLCLCGNFYGFKAFYESILLYLYNYYPNCLIGLILVILSIIKLKKTHRA